MFLTSIHVDKNPGNNLLSNVVQARIRELLAEKSGPLFYGEYISKGNDEVIGLVNTSGDGQATFEDLVTMLEKVRDILLSEYDISLTIGLDGVIQEPSDCADVYARVCELQKNRFALGENQVIYPARVMELLPEPLNYPDKLIQEILAALNRGDRTGFDEKTEAFLETIRQYTYGAASVIFARLYLEMAARIQQYAISEKGHGPMLKMKMDPETRQEAQELLQNAFAVFKSRRESVEELKTNRHYKKIVEGRQFIMEHYADCTLSVELIAERLGYSTNYFARVFKTITGYYVNDYIRQVRIMKAQELLQNTDMTVNEISQATGFTTSNYFYAIFKKETGMTPAAYRSSI